MWRSWISGRRDWNLGNVVPEEILYFLNGPAIFTARVGLSKFIFFKFGESECEDYYLATSVGDRELTALKEGRLSVRGALSKPSVWLLETDFDLAVRRFEERSESGVLEFLPKSGVPLLNRSRVAPDSLSQAEALFAFKFYGSHLAEGEMPFSTFRDLVDGVYGVVRNALTPFSLTQGRDRRLLDFPVRQPEFASLLIAIGRPTLDAAGLLKRDRTRNLDPGAIVAESHSQGEAFASQVDRAVHLASGGRLSAEYAAENFTFLQQIVNILPGRSSEVKKLQFSSSSGGEGGVFVEIDANIGDRIRQSFEIAEERNVYIKGVVTGILGKSKTFRLQAEFGREITCQLGFRQFDLLVDRNRLRFGARLGVSGRYTKRKYRDKMQVDGDPHFF